MNSSVLIELATNTKVNLRVFTLYVDFAAGVRAKRIVNEIKGIAGEEFACTSEMWKLDAVAPVGPIRKMIAQEAGESDVLIVAASQPDHPDPLLAEWLNLLVNWKAGRLFPGLLVGLLGAEDHVVDTANWMVNELTAFARQTRMHWVWHAGARQSWDNSQWLADGLGRALERKRQLPV